MSKIKPVGLFISFLIVISSLSCKKNKGCTDKDATNYNADAQEDDGSCNYVSYMVFWFNQTTANHLISSGYSNIKCTIDGAEVGSTQPGSYFNSAPTCGQSNSLTITEQMGNNKSKTIEYVFKDAVSGNVIWSGSIDLTTGVCSPKYLSY